MNDNQVNGQLLLISWAGIKLKLQGKAKTHWKETSGRSTTHFAEEEVYIDEKVYLVGYGKLNTSYFTNMYVT